MSVVKTGACAQGEVKNPCKKLQGLPKDIVGYLLAKKGQSFNESFAESDIKTDIQNKTLQVGYKMYGEIDQPQEEGITQSSTGDFRSGLRQLRATIKHKLNAYQKAVLESWENAYDRVYFYGSDNLIHGVFNNQGEFEGIPLYSLLVGASKLPSGDVSKDLMFQFRHLNISSIKKDIDFFDVEGIYNVDFDIVSSSNIEIVFTAKACCGELASLEQADIVLSDSSGVAQTIGGLAYANGQYTLSGTGLVSGTLATAGVVDKTEFLVEGSIAVTIS